MSGPQRRRLIFPRGGLGAHLRLPMLPAGEVSQEKDAGTRADFSPPPAPGVSTVRSCSRGLAALIYINIAASKEYLYWQAHSWYTDMGMCIWYGVDYWSVATPFHIASGSGYIGTGPTRSPPREPTKRSCRTMST